VLLVGVGRMGKVQGLPSAGDPEFQARHFLKIVFPLPGNHNSQLFMLYGRLVHVGKTFNRFYRFWTVNCICKCFPVLFYGLEACSLRKYQYKSI